MNFSQAMERVNDGKTARKKSWIEGYVVWRDMTKNTLIIGFYYAGQLNDTREVADNFFDGLEATDDWEEVKDEKQSNRRI